MNEKEEKKYMVFRVYTRKERPIASERERVVFFGWSKSKTVVKAFREQRDKRKYVVHKMSDEDICEMFSEDVTDSGSMIDFIKLISVQTQEEVIFFSTANELRTAEIYIQNMMKDSCSLSEIPGNGPYVEMFNALEEHYADALYYLGFRPIEVEAMFPSYEYDTVTGCEKVEDEINMAYDGLMISPEEIVTKNTQPLGLTAITDVSSKILYSLESFIKVLKDEL